MKRMYFIFALLALCVAATAQTQLVNNRLNFDFDWKFTLADDASYSDPSTDDSAWRDVQLPHDWNIEQDFVRESGGNAAYLPGGIGWYRKAFTLPKAWDGKHVSVLFDGIFMQSDVYRISRRARRTCSPCASTPQATAHAGTPGRASTATRGS